jgi:hypothetical protein
LIHSFSMLGLLGIVVCLSAIIAFALPGVSSAVDAAVSAADTLRGGCCAFGVSGLPLHRLNAFWAQVTQENAMKPLHHHLPLLVTVLLAAAALVHGPIAQPSGYHDFADQDIAFGIPHFGDVVSNLGFAIVAAWGWWRLAPASRHPDIGSGWAGYRLFLIGLFLTAFGSTWYHLAPDNASLVWDRLPIALACGGLLAGVRGDVLRRDSRDLATWLALVAMVSVGWWYYTADPALAADLRHARGRPSGIRRRPRDLCPRQVRRVGRPPNRRRAGRCHRPYAQTPACHCGGRADCRPTGAPGSGTAHDAAACPVRAQPDGLRLRQ